MDFSQVEIGKLLGCSARTIRRRILDYELQYIQEFSQMSDADLDEIVTEQVTHLRSLILLVNLRCNMFRVCKQ